jgi:hypothetical protein
VPPRALTTLPACGSLIVVMSRYPRSGIVEGIDRVGLKKDAVEIVLDGADEGVSDKTPDFVKSLPVWKAIEDGPAWLTR